MRVSQIIAVLFPRLTTSADRESEYAARRAEWQRGWSADRIVNPGDAAMIRRWRDEAVSEGQINPNSEAAA